MFKFFTEEEVNNILRNPKYRIEGTDEEKLKRIKHIDETDALIIRFERMRNFTYKNRKSLILHYPSISINNKIFLKNTFKKKVPFIGNIFLSRGDSNKTELIPFAECIIKEVYLPEELADYWNKMINIQKQIDTTLYNIYINNIKEELEQIEPELADAFDLLFQQLNYEDYQVYSIIKLNNVGKVHTRNSALVWMKCEVLEYYTSSHLMYENHKVGFYEYLKNYKFYPRSIVYGLTMKEYYKFRENLCKASDYCVGEVAKRKAFSLLDDLDGLKALDFQTRYKVFSEEAWRDLLCKEQFVFIDNMKNCYSILFHLILEVKNNKKYNLIDFDTEVKCFSNANKTKNNYIDAFLHFYDEQEKKAIRYYIEFKNYKKTIYEDEKDYLYQPKAILNNNFYVERYKHQENDVWYYLVITKGSPYDNIKGNSIMDSGILLDNYIDFPWTEVFNIIEKYIQQIASESIDKSLIGFLRFLERV